MEHLQNVSISGAGRIGGGTYDQVKISGSGKVTGELECQELHVSGSASLQSNVKAGSIGISGSGHIHGNASAGTIHISGSGHVDGDLMVTQEVHISGSGKIGGLLKAETASVSGSVHIGNGAECENFTVSGACHVEGLLNVGTLEIKCKGNSQAEDIGAETVTVKKGQRNPLKIFGISLFGGDTGSLTAATIEANAVKLEVTRANVVRGGLVEIGEGCEIGRVEYTHSAIVSPNAKVGELVKIEA